MAPKEPPDPKAQVEVEVEPDPEFTWRLEQLDRAGFERFTAFRLAVNQADWHKAVHLRDLGFTEPQILDQLID